MFYQITVITNSYQYAMVANKKASKIKNFFVLQIAFVSIKFVVTVFVSSSIISLHVIAEFSIILTKYF